MIYLLKTSPHNENFLIDEGYATNEEELKRIAVGYCKEYFGWNIDNCIIIDDILACYEAEELSKEFHIVKINLLTY